MDKAHDATKLELVTGETSLGRIHLGAITESLAVSRDSKRMAYGALRGGRWLVVVDGQEGNGYDGVIEGSPIFSPDGNRVAYGAARGGKRFVVVDGQEGKEYDGLLRGAELVFDSAAALHSLADRNNEIFLIEIEIVEK